MPKIKLIDAPLIYGATTDTAANLTGATVTQATTKYLNITNGRTINLLIDYTPRLAQTNNFISIFVDFATEDVLQPATITHWRTFGVVAYNTAVVQNQAEGGPYVFPYANGSPVSVGGTVYTVQLSFSDIAARWMRIKVWENVASNNGTLLLKASYYEEY